MNDVASKKDLSRIEYEKCTAQQWKSLIEALDSGDAVQIDESVWEYFLEVLPPRYMGHGGFAFAEGLEHPRWFSKDNQGRCFGRTIYGDNRKDYRAGWRELSNILGVKVGPSH